MRSGDSMDRLDQLLEGLQEDAAKQGRPDVLPRGSIRSVDDKKAAIRGLMNIRMPAGISAELRRLQDDYLQGELREKGIVPLQDIPTVREQYGSRHAYGDRISLWQGDITRLQAGAIVNAANSRMLGCFVPCHRCIDNAIHSAAGMQLREECDHIMGNRRMQYGGHYEEPVGTATLTRAYNLPCDYVIHTVGPIVYGSLTDALRQELRNCYDSVLECCVEHRIRSVAFCCISTGEFHFPGDEAAQIAVRAVEDFCESGRGGGVERIIFNVFKDTDRELYEQILK